jgi:hypothetical protein
VYARVATFSGAPENIERGLGIYEDQVLPWAREATGYRGWAVLLDRSRGSALALTFWESEADARANEEAAMKFRRRLGGGIGVEATGADFYEVIAFDPPAASS